MEGLETVRDPGPKTAPRRPRGFLDLVAVALAFYAMVITTPLGGLIVRAHNRVFGVERATRPLLSYFEVDGQSAAGAALAAQIAEPPGPDAATSVIARRVGVSPELARAVAVLAANGKESGGHLDVTLGPAARASLAAVGAVLPPDGATAEERERRLIEGLSKLRDHLGGEEAAVAALAVSLEHVAFAVERARREVPPAPAVSPGPHGQAGDEAARYERLRPFLPPEHRAEADALVGGTFALLIAFQMEWPVGPEWPVSSPFGYRSHPVLGRRSFHGGTDLAVPTGTEIGAIASGRVVHAAEDSVNGRFVKIDHGHGLTSAYCHASELRVRRGEHVEKGRKVALSGSTGRSTGPHLHFQMELNGKPVNPELFRRTTRLARR